MREPIRPTTLSIRPPAIQRPASPPSLTRLEPLVVDDDPREQVQKAGACEDEDRGPKGAEGQPHGRREQLGATAAQEDGGEKVGGCPQQGVGEIRDDGAERPDEIAGDAARVRRGGQPHPKPRRHIRRGVGDEREKKQRPGSEQPQSKDFAIQMIFPGTGHEERLS